MKGRPKLEVSFGAAIAGTRYGGVVYRRHPDGSVWARCRFGNRKDSKVFWQRIDPEQVPRAVADAFKGLVS
jgi:hypothetical protein